MLLLFFALIKHAEGKQRNFDPTNATSEEIVQRALAFGGPFLSYLETTPDALFLGRFLRKVRI